MHYRFADCELDVQACTLTRLGQGVTLRLKVLQVLIYLLEHRERVVSKQELSEQVWPEQFVSDAVIESTVWAVRQAVGDRHHPQQCIQTLRGHGYRFIAEVIPSDPVPPAAREPVAEPLATDGNVFQDAPQVLSCGRCRTSNAPGARFCSGCGAALVAPCRQCGFVAAQPAAFCPECGQRLPAGAQTALSAPPPAPHGARATTVSQGREPTVTPVPAAQRLRPRTRSRFMGRHVELTALHAALRRVENGSGQVVALVGEPGIGKSRLLAEFRHNVLGQALTEVGEPGIGKARLLAEFRHQSNSRPVMYLTAACQPWGRDTPYLPLQSLLRQLCGLSELDAAALQRLKVRTTLQELGIVPDDVAPCLLHLLGIAESTAAMSSHNPQAQRLQAFAACHELFVRSSQRHLLVLEVENVHWIDPSSAAYLTALVQRLTTATFLLLSTSRPGYQPAWATTASTVPLLLSPFTPRDSQRLLQHFLPAAWRAHGAFQEMVTQAQGNPMFLEEYAKLLRAQEGSSVCLPAAKTLVQVLTARLAQLPETTQQVLQTVALLGLDAPLPLLQELLSLSEAMLLPHLQLLQAQELLYESHQVPVVRYTLKHMLLREVVYQSVPLARRQQMHANMVQALIAQFPDLVEAHPALVAQHAMDAGLYPIAAHYWQQAGQWAQTYAALTEAMSHFSKSLEALAMLPPTPAHLAQQESVRQALQSCR